MKKKSSGKVKILVVCQYYYPEPFRITDICEELVRRGHKVTVLTGLPNYPEGEIHPEYKFGKNRNETINGVQVKRVLEIPRGKSKAQLFLNYFSFALSGSIKSLNLKKDFDVIFVNQLSPVFMTIPAIVYKKVYNKKLFLYCLDLWPASLASGGISQENSIYKIIKKISKWIYQSADGIAVTSKMFIRYFDQDLKVDTNKISYLPQYAEDLFGEDNTNNKLNNDFNLVFAGNVGVMQSVETIVEAAKILKENNKIIFHIVGDGTSLEGCKALATLYELDNVIFYGRKPITDMPNYYNMADVMLLTLKKDDLISYTLPGKVQSYMAAGKPIVASIDGEGQRLINEANCGYASEAENPKLLAENILKMSTDAKMDLLGINSLNYYRKEFNKQKFMDSLESELILLGDSNV
ncbi:glycosyltransferase family 4 protein [Chryseomicrobium sp. FSL W7-1435]|uniref:glycosyltransferase family 4 protein n=1 Tax=Chryseomicrobium sp. FSL W7-1435 TaxID=2921704 RepID=UPI00315B3E07